MSILKTLSHAEQMEALKAEFDGLWQDEEYRLINAGLNPKARFWAMQSAWTVFKMAKARQQEAGE